MHGAEGDFSAVINRKFPSFDGGITHFQDGIVSSFYRTGGVRPDLRRLQRLIRSHHHSRVLSRLERVNFAVFEFGIDLIAADPLMCVAGGLLDLDVASGAYPIGASFG